MFIFLGIQITERIVRLPFESAIVKAFIDDQEMKHSVYFLKTLKFSCVIDFLKIFRVLLVKSMMQRITATLMV